MTTIITSRNIDLCVRAQLELFGAGRLKARWLRGAFPDRVYEIHDCSWHDFRVAAWA